MRIAKQLIRNALRSAGLDIVRVRQTATPSGHGTPGWSPPEPATPPASTWPVPAELRERSEPWARVLTILYDSPGSWPACVSPETGMLIHSLVRNLRPRLVVETGTCHAASTLWMAAALAHSEPPGILHSFDNFSPPPDEATARLPIYTNHESLVRARIVEAGLDHIARVHAGDSAAEITARRATLLPEGGVHLAFIDGDHSPRGVLRDFQAVEPSLAVGGFILLHDVWPAVCTWTGPRWLADNIASVAHGTYQQCNLYTAPRNYSLSILRRVN